MRFPSDHSAARFAACVVTSVGLAFVCSGAVPGPAGGTFNVRSYGAKADGVADDSAALKKAVEAAMKAGEGSVV